MDKFKSKKKLYAGLGDYARKMRGEEMKKKYSTGNPQLDAASEMQDEAAEGAEMPKTQPKGFSLTIGVGDVAKDADKWAAENDAALAEMSEDEEMEKWTRKQKG